jgi:hypothetical protein
MNLNSKKVLVKNSAPSVCDFLSDVKNFEQLMPESISKFEIIRENAFVFALKGMPEIALEVKEVNSPNNVILGAISDKIPFKLRVNVAAIDESTSEAEFLFSGEFNSMMAMMIKSPLNKLLETLAENLKKT